MASQLADALGLCVKTWPVLPFAFLFLGVRVIFPQVLGRQIHSKEIEYFGVFSAVFFLAWLWLSFVSVYVPDPYLDEFFHIPQAQKYCDGRYSEWDDKITTPPGLYGLTMSYRAFDRWILLKGADCSEFLLRSFNAWAVVATGFIAMLCRNLIEARLNDARSTTRLKSASYYAFHTGINIALFPVLFFFSGLYYTDIASSLCVLVAYHNHLQRVRPWGKSLPNDVWTVLLGIMALFMRQTNVFWVVFYMGGLEVVYAVKALNPPAVDQPSATTLAGQLEGFARRCESGDVHDPPANVAWLDDYLWCAISVGIAAVCNPVPVLRQVWPYVTVLALFGAFVVVNGGVVLGDKSNHIATIHLAQMLYIWPLFAFFSAPLMLQYSVIPLKVLRSAYINLVGHSKSPTLTSGATAELTKRLSKHRPNATPPSPSRSKALGDISRPGDAVDQSAALKMAARFFGNHYYYWVYLPATIALSLAIVRFNTIIHPFTLADNRHYMFYVFRHTIRRTKGMRYYLIGAYTACRWLVWQAQLGCTDSNRTPQCSGFYSQERDAPYVNHPFWTPSGLQKRQTRAPKMQLGPQAQLYGDELVELSALDDPATTATEPVPASNILLLWVAAALSLVTAPLVEPRYFILPWMFWRLIIPAWRVHEHQPLVEYKLERVPGMSAVFALGRKHDLRLVVETLWFLAINAATMYVFIARPYQWRAEDGTLLDGGKQQRFMW